jgi:hypothetical protein
MIRPLGYGKIGMIDVPGKFDPQHDRPLGESCVSSEFRTVAFALALLVVFLGPSSQGMVAPAFAASADGVGTSRGTPTARLLTSEFSSEHWELTARFNSGHFLFVDFLITNIGWGDRSAAVTGHVLTPEGKTYSFHSGRREGRWTLSPDRLRLDCGKSSLDLHTPRYQFTVTKKNLRLQITFRPDETATWSESLTRSGYALDLLAAAVPVKGSLWLDEAKDSVPLEGTLTATHSWMNELGSSLILRRLEFFSLREELPLYGLDLMTPEGSHRRWLVMKHQGKTSAWDEFALSTDDTHPLTKDAGYTIPSSMHFQGTEAQGDLQFARLLLSNDPFEHLPTPLRFLASVTLHMNPRRLWTLSPFHVITPQEPRSPEGNTPLSPPGHYEGVGITTFTYLNPLPTPRTTSAAAVTPLRQVQTDQLRNRIH